MIHLLILTTPIALQVIGATLAKVVSEPPARYVLEGGPATLKCHYANEDGVFQNYITNAQWYRYFPNGSSDPIGENSPVSVYMYSLIFYPTVREVDQGNYYCCAPGGGCSAQSLVAIAVPPVVAVVTTNYTAFVGSSVTLVCKIVDKGSPPASFRWRRHGLYIPDDHTVTNDTHTMLPLTNLAEADNGFYRCVADGVLTFNTHEVYLNLQVFPEIIINGPVQVVAGTTVSINCSVLQGRPSPDIHITTPSGEIIEISVIMFTATSNDTGNYTCVGSTSQIKVTASHHLSVTTVNETGTSNSSVNMTSFLYYFLVTLHSARDCNFVKKRGFPDQLATALKHYIEGMEDYDIQVIPILFKCIGDSTALYDVEITGNMINNHLKEIQIAVELGIVTLTICNQSCEVLSTDVFDQQQDVNNDKSLDSSVIIGLSVSVLFTVIILIFIAVVAALFCVRYRNKKCQQDVVRCTEAFTPSEPNTIETIAATSTDNKPMQVGVNVKISIVKTDEATSPSLVCQ